MKKQELNSRIRAFRGVTLTVKEKQVMLEAIMKGHMVSPYAPIVSRWSVRPRAFAYAVLALLLVITGGGSLYGAERAVPGDTFYALKIGVSEPLRTFLTLDPLARAEWEREKVERRLAEAETLALEGRLTDEYRVLLENQFLKHIDSFNTSLSSIEAADAAENVHTELDASLSAHANILEKVARESQSDSRAEAVELERAVRDSVVRHPDKPLKIEKGEPTRDQKSQSQKDAAFESKKTAVKGLIRSVEEMVPERQGSAVASGTPATASSTLPESIIEDSRMNLEKARQHLDSAAVEKEQGKDDEAYTSLRESQKAAIEAKVSVTEGLKIERAQSEGKKDSGTNGRSGTK